MTSYCFPCFVSDSTGQETENWLSCREGKMTSHTFVCPLAVQAQFSCFTVLSMISHISANIGALDAELENNKNRCSNFGCSSFMHLCSKSTFSIIRPDFSFLNLIVSRLLRIIVDIITSRAAACFHTKAELWRAKMKFLHYQACFLFYHAHTA